ncbi:high affinity choline transporter 1-like isoform X1 [Synchiropus splendidus]|uniref:high affinity choline transporter 1-like n=1 Tax=Synchiropus splendidus TaxID=270530 RepID=UPI00237E030C|nr:high affinity choline transporter 1-like [Synchiropus splendidus]XP_053713493.1 high affinity choline transporter 1-like [Synchiropus splendidus]XP_053713494.1 high affinity choline transporter 1-like [Synchiropus splendidus]XP_053713495.1 high affinity choline transporter 1-like [Synchiropus splendidus]XP_053713496.1 high affinity choline transporter 1-like [Synchiropus splendidus]XP_053713497.1 high affinity choline transporter 1-like [Synchiropus splendidus]XP_053713498.1 high affinity 
MALNVPGLVVMAVFYLLILGTGIWASMRSRKEERKWTGDGIEITLLAGRKITLLVGIFTLTATWVGGGFILGIAEATYNPTLGAVWALMPVPYVVTFFLGGFFFAKPMRENKYVTMMDPFQQKYGNFLSSALIFPALVADVLWVARTLVSLGGTMRVILDLSYVYSIIISSVVAIIYTLLGGLYSVAYTDVIQLILIFISLWVCVPFMMTNPYSLDISLTAYNQTFQAPWVGTVELDEAGKWFDDFMLLALGGLAYQAFYQRILSASSYSQAQVTCFASSAFCLVLGIPSVLIGAVAASTDWNATTYGLPTPYERGEAGSILPIALQFLTPMYVSVIGIGAVAAAVMSSMDSALLSSASLFSSNIYKNIIRKQASDREMQWVIRISVVVVGLAGTALTFLDNSVLVFWIVGVDMSYTIMFPQLVCILFFKVSNGYGATVGYIMGIVLRVLSGEPLIGLPPAIRFPGCRLDKEGKLTQFFPFRTAIMVISLLSILLFSWLASIIFNKGLLSEKWDVFQVKRKQKPPNIAPESKKTNVEPEDGSKQLLDTTSC